MKIVIVGGGASGILLAINLLRLRDHQPLDIAVIDKNPPETLGIAYSTALQEWEKRHWLMSFQKPWEAISRSHRDL